MRVLALQGWLNPSGKRHERLIGRPAAAIPCRCEALEQRRLLTVYFVSPTGSNQSPGTVDAPFATIQQAASVAGPGDTVVVHAGTYRETVKPAHSGTATSPITYEPYGDGPVVVSGADPITGWTLAKGSIYQSPVGWDLGNGNNQVFVDGQAINEARWPATSLDLSLPAFAHTQSATFALGDGDFASTATIYDPALTQPAGFWVGGTIHIAPGAGWAIQSGSITASAPGQITYNYTSYSFTRPYENPSGGNEFYLTGVAGALNAPGEFFLGGGTVSLWTPDDTNPQAHDIEVKHRLFAFDLSGLSDVRIRGFSIFAAGIITDANSQGILLSDLNMKYVSQDGVRPLAWGQPAVAGVYLNGTGDILRDSTIAFSAAAGVALNGNNDVVQGCIIHDFDCMGSNLQAIYLSGNNDIAEDNVVYNGAREGIRTENAATIINNVVYDVMLQTTDGGGIYTFDSNGTGGEIAYNQVYNVNTGGFGGVGIYLDNNSSNWLVDHNTVWNCTSAMKLNPVNTDDRIQNNILADSKYSITSSGSASMPGTVFSGNLFTSSATIGPGATELADAHGGTFTPPADPAVDPTLADGHGSLTPPVSTGPTLAADARRVAGDQAQLAIGQAGKSLALTNDTAATNAAVAAAKLKLKNDTHAEPAELAAEAMDIRRARAAAMKTARAQAKGAARRKLLAQLLGAIPTLAQYRRQLKAALAADRAAIPAALAQGQATATADQAQWAAVVSADQQTLAADAAMLQNAASP